MASRKSSSKDSPTAQEHVDIFRAWAKGLTPEAIAQTFEVSAPEVREIIREAKQNRPMLLEQDPLDVLQEHEIRLESLIEDLATFGSRESGAVRVRALAVKFEALKHQLDLSQAIGLVPAGPDFAMLRDGVAMADRMLDLLERHGVLTEEMLDQIMEEFPGRGRALNVGQERRDSSGA